MMDYSFHFDPDDDDIESSKTTDFDGIDEDGWYYEDENYDPHDELFDIP